MQDGSVKKLQFYNIKTDEISMDNSCEIHTGLQFSNFRTIPALRLENDTNIRYGDLVINLCT